jgi:hypothetical protein
MGITNEKALMLQEGANNYLANPPEIEIDTEKTENLELAHKDNESDPTSDTIK